jgi:hypothetical protein
MSDDLPDFKFVINQHTQEGYINMTRCIPAVEADLRPTTTTLGTFPGKVALYM